MWNLMNKINKIDIDSDTGNGLTAVRGEEGWGLGEKGEGIEQLPPKLVDTNSMVITRGKWGWEEVEEGGRA